MSKNVVLVIAGISVVLLFISGCETLNDLSAGTGGASTAYDAKEEGRHWVRPQEVTYELGEITSIETSVDLSDERIQEAIVLGYPQPGARANLFVSLAAARAARQEQSDGFLVTSYEIEEQSTGGTADSAEVVLQGRPLRLESLGPVSTERADQERFRTIEEISETDDETVTTITTLVNPDHPAYDSSLQLAPEASEPVGGEGDGNNLTWWVLGGTASLSFLLLAVL